MHLTILVHKRKQTQMHSLMFPRRFKLDRKTSNSAGPQCGTGNYQSFCYFGLYCVCSYTITITINIRLSLILPKQHKDEVKEKLCLVLSHSIVCNILAP